jgi:cytochrome c oxidase assembly factor CtaG
MIIATFLFPAVNGAITVWSIVLLVSMVAIGIAIFYTARAVRLKNEGIDITWTFKSVPPV